MPVDLGRKKRVRAGHRAAATKIIRRSEELLSETTLDKDQLTQLKMALAEKMEVLKLLDAEVLDMVEDDAIAGEIEQTDDFKEGEHVAMIRIERALAPPPVTAVPAPVDPRDRHATTDPPATPRPTSNVKLPKLNIPPFNGELTAWTPFWESYQAAIHTNSGLSDTEKFSYLRSLVQQVALDAISGLSLTGANYREAITILEKRFGNKQQIIAKHMDALLNAEAVVSHNVKSLRRLFDFVETHVRSLKSLGVTSDSYGGILASVLLSKLPQDLQLIVSRKIGGDEWNLNGMMNVIEEEVRARERTTAASAQTLTPRKPKEPSTAATLLTGHGSGPTCTYCQQAHPSTSCGVVTQLQARRQVLQKTGRCFICLRRGHISRECRGNLRCSKCKGRHHISICPNAFPEPRVSTQPRTTGTNSIEPPVTQPTPIQPGPTQPAPRANPPAAQQPGLNTRAPAFQSTNSHATSLWVGSNQAVFLQTARALVFNPYEPQISQRVRIVLDCGSQRSYVTEKIAQNLSLAPEGKQPLTIMTFGASEQRSCVCESVRLSIYLENGQSQGLVLSTVPHICEPLTCQPVSICQGNFNHLVGLNLADPSDGSSSSEIDILIGSDQYWELVTGETRRGDFGPVAINTKMGWVLSGATTPPVHDTPSTCLLTHTLRVDGLPQGSQSLDDRLKTFWELESFGISGSERSVQEEFGSTIRFVDGKYEVELPWKEGHPELPDNYHLSLKRLHGLSKRLKQDPAILREYNSIIQDQLRRGIVEMVEPVADSPHQIHYLPHHAVVRCDKETTKVRVVYDASARSDGPSLNDCLHAGPKLNQKILDILLRFRVHRIAVIADIEKAFLMVSMSRKDRDVLRFLWYRDPFADQLDIVEMRFTRVVFGVSSSPFLLNATIRHHLEQYDATQPDLVKKLRDSIYVDDLVSGANSEEEACQLFMKSKNILKEGGFNLRKFYSNSACLQARVDSDANSEIPVHGSSGIEESEETYTSSTLGAQQKSHFGDQKVLGVQWDRTSDQFVVNLNEISSIARGLEPTKRSIVSLVGRFYDPIGFLAPVVVHFKMFFQELCEAKLDWDQPLTGKLLERWQLLKSGLGEGQTILIPRCYFSDVLEQLISCTLCGFCDASLKAYAGVVYLLLETTTSLSVKFIAAKTRVAPLQKQTIPRLELLSALLLARLLTSVTQSLEQELQLSPSRCFTDSTVALCWIKGAERTWKPFVQNRANEIRKLTQIDSWRHCSGRDNPADIPSRGLSPLELSVSVLWRNGPSWLRERDLGGDEELPFPEECLAELRAKDRQLTHGLLTTESAPRLSHFMNCEDFSSADRLLSTTALVLKFCWIMLNKVRNEGTVEPPDLNVEAEHRWILECQQMVVADKNFKDWRKQLDLFQDESGVWRCKGRIQNADIPYSTKHPILLHKNHPLSVLLVRRAHSRVLHNGVKETLTELRSKYWIIQGRNFIKSLIHQCRVCRRHEGKSYRAPPPPPLPAFRVEEAPPFSYTGVDFAGPLYVSSDSSGVKKVWICLYTCCVVRAVHLELVFDMSTPTFIRCFKRFVARRGLPSKILSDNGKTFKAAAKFIHGVKWIFNVPKAPWWGGVFERLVRCTKRCLRKIIGQAKFSFDELATAITEVETVLNSRPLSYVSADDLEEPLTPSHLMVGRRLMNMPDYPYPDLDEFDVNSAVLNRRAKYLSATINRFWERWRKEYLVGLREAHRLQKRTSHAPQLSVGDVVIIHSDDQPRGLWKLGLVEELLTGPDGEHRAAVLRVAGQGRNAKRLQRPVQRLYPLELTSMGEQSDASTCTTQEGLTNEIPHRVGEAETDVDNDALSPVRRPRRAAALAARDRLVAQSLDEEEL